MRVYLFLGIMWVLIISGGGVAVLVLGPLQFGPSQELLTSIVKGAVAILMVILWVVVLVRLKSYIFRR